MITIRPLTPADIPELRDLAIRIYRETFAHLNTEEDMELFLATDYSVARFEEEFREPHSWYFFAVDGATTAGYLRLRKTSEVEHLLGSNTLELHRIYVDRPFQGKRVGTILMQHAIDMATAQKADWLWLGVWEKNPKAFEFYTRWGFEKFSEHVFQMGSDAQTDWLLRRRIIPE